jgi:predicted transcriptional regulator
MSANTNRRKPFMYGDQSCAEYPIFSIRMAPEMVDRLDQSARANYRSRNAEIVARLQESMKGESFDVHSCIVKQAPAAGKAVDDHQGGGH